ncbi:MAG: hypothetical protein QW638_02955 [Candidatus Bathyarchaeia archaeon]|nr:hypothetical protein [Candidatus Bathyarchaeota archaeon]
MGGVHKPSAKARNRLIKEVLEGLDPKVRDSVKKLIDSYHGEELDRKLKELMSIKKTMKLVELRE